MSRKGLVLTLRTPNKKKQSFAGRNYLWTWSGSIRNRIWTKTTTEWYNTAEMYTTSHPRDRRSGKYLEGGPFYVKSSRFRELEFTREVAGANAYYGTLAANFNTVGLPARPADPAMLTIEAMNSNGASLVSKCLPTSPSFSLATFLGELREGLPHIIGSSLKDRTDYLRKSGDEYLNVEFGWKPMMSDLRGFAKAVKLSHSTIRQYVRDSDRKIMRRYATPISDSTETYYAAGWFAPASLAVPATTQLSVETREQLWFEGAFRYHVPVGDSQWDKFRRAESIANRILGTRLTPEVVWNLSPWSWAIDWFTNAGDVMHNISVLGADGLVMQYGYVMRTRSITESLTQTGSVNPSLRARIVQERSLKQRESANPYGFGVTDSSLSARQLAILAALGLSKR